MKPIGVLTVLGVALALAVPAHAKVVEKMTICGEGECETFAGGPHDLIEGELVVAPAPLGHYYRVEVTVGDGAGAHATFTQYYLRSGGTPLLVHGDDDGANSFLTLRRGQARGAHVYGKRTSGLAPLPAPTLTEVRVDGEPVDDPASYGVLLTLFDEQADYPSDPGWQTIELRAAGDNPWSSVALHYSPGADTLVSGVSYAKVPPQLARRLEVGASLAGVESSAGFAWPLVGGWLVVAAGLALAAALLVRRGRREAA